MKKTLLFGCGGMTLLVFLGGVALVAWLASMPEGGVKLSNEMDGYAVEYLNDNQLLNAGEAIVAYYDATISMNGTEAAILTTDRVMYHKAPNTTAIAISDVRDVRHRTESLIGDIIEVYAESGAVLKIEIAPLNQGESFKNALMNLWQRSQTTSAADA